MTLPLWAWLLNALFAVAGLLAAGYTMAVRFMHELQVHDLRLEAHRLRAIYEERLDALRRGEVTLESASVPAEDESPGRTRHAA